MAIQTRQKPPPTSGRKMELQDRFWAIRETLGLIREGLEVVTAALGLVLFAAVVVYLIIAMFKGNLPMPLEVTVQTVGLTEAARRCLKRRKDRLAEQPRSQRVAVVPKYVRQ